MPSVWQISPKDMLVSVDDISLVGKSASEIESLIAGPEGVLHDKDRALHGVFVPISNLI